MAVMWRAVLTFQEIIIAETIALTQTKHLV